MLVRCSWCKPKRIIGEKEPLDDTSITDGICDDCLNLYFPHLADKVRAHLEVKDGYSI